jgi:Tfp pilus assembly protein PilF
MIRKIERQLDRPVFLIPFGIVLAGVTFAVEAADVLGKYKTAATIAGGVLAAASVIWGLAKGFSDNRRRRRRLLLCNPPPRVHEVRATDVGAARSPLAEQLSHSPDPPYVEREIDAELARVLVSSSFVVVRGRPKTGKSRTAFEAIRRTFPDWQLVALRAGARVSEAVEAGVFAGGPTILWLDKIDGFLRTGGLGPGDPDDVRAEQAETKIVGTLENAAWSAILGLEADDPSFEAAETLRSAADVELESATAEELGRASEAYGGEAFEGGIAEHFVGVAESRRRYDGVVDRELTAVIRAVVDWHRTGMPSGIRRSDLEKLALQYLDGADPADWYKRGLEWANEEKPDGVRLIVAEISSAGRVRYRVPDHLVAYVAGKEDSTVHDHAWNVALRRASAESALAIASQALAADCPDVAEAGLVKAHSKSDSGSDTRVTAAARLGLFMRRQGRDEEAETYYREAIEGDSITARNNYGFMLLSEGRLDEAQQVLTDAVNRGNRTAAFNLLRTLVEADRLDRAEAVFQPAVEAANPAAALVLGNAQHSVGDLDSADRLYTLAEQGPRARDADFALRARMLRAIIAFERDEQQARERFEAAWDEKQWSETLKYLKRVGLERLDEMRQQLQPRGVTPASG